jgi:glycosyltransferase involved in cell wall biosynthesis
MNICIISYTLTFADTRVIKYVKYYLSLGHTVYCYGLDKNKNNNLQANNFYYKNIFKKKTNNIYKFSTSFFLEFFKLLVMLPYALILSIRYIKKIDINFLKNTLNSLNSFKRYLLATARLLEIFKEKKIDIIHIHDIWVLPAAFVLKKKNPNAKVIIDLHELYSELPFQTNLSKFVVYIFYYYIKLNLRKIYKIVTINEPIKNYYIKKFKFKSLVVINNSCEDIKISNSISVKKIPLKLRLLKQKGKKILIYQGGLSIYRGIEEMCNFFLKYPPENWFFLIIGSGSLEPEINNIINKTNNIYKIPLVSLNELSNYSAFADMGLINYENNCLNHNFCNPNKLWEYSRCGLPMMLSNCQSFIDLNKKYQFAKIIDSKNIASLSKIFKSLDNQILSKMSKNSRLFYDNKNWEKEKKIIDRELLAIK